MYKERIQDTSFLFIVEKEQDIEQFISLYFKKGTGYNLHLGIITSLEPFTSLSL